MDEQMVVVICKFCEQVSKNSDPLLSEAGNWKYLKIVFNEKKKFFQINSLKLFGGPSVVINFLLIPLPETIKD